MNQRSAVMYTQCRFRLTVLTCIQYDSIVAFRRSQSKTHDNIMGFTLALVRVATSRLLNSKQSGPVIEIEIARLHSLLCMEVLSSVELPLESECCIVEL